MARGTFVVFEGLDGAGTTTQLRRAAAWLRVRGLRVAETHEPSDGPVGRLLRDAVEGRVALPPEALALAFAADRLDHARGAGGIEATLAAGSWVASDRYLLSGLAYQAAQGVQLDWLVALNSHAPAPDLTIYIDTPVDVCLARIAARGEHAGDLFHRRELLKAVRAQYQRVLGRRELTGRLVRVAGDTNVDVVARAVEAALAGALAEAPLAREP